MPSSNRLLFRASVALGTALWLATAGAQGTGDGRGSPRDGDVPSPASILADIDRNGAQSALDALDAQPATFEHALDAIESADPIWLDVARRLRPAADGGFAEGLDMAMARALPNDPVRVLKLVDQGIPLARLCTSPFIEPEPGVAEAYATRTLAALANVRDPKLRDRAAHCAARVGLPLTRAGSSSTL